MTTPPNKVSPNTSQTWQTPPSLTDPQCCCSRRGRRGEGDDLKLFSSAHCQGNVYPSVVVELRRRCIGVVWCSTPPSAMLAYKEALPALVTGLRVEGWRIQWSSSTTSCGDGRSDGWGCPRPTHYVDMCSLVHDRFLHRFT